MIRDNRVENNVAKLTFGLVSHVKGTILMLMVISGSILVHAIEDRIISMGFHMLFQILRSLEGLATESAAMRLQRYVDSNV